MICSCLILGFTLKRVEEEVEEVGEDVVGLSFDCFPRVVFATTLSTADEEIWEFGKER